MAGLLYIGTLKPHGKMENEMETGMKLQGSGLSWAWRGIFYRDSVGMWGLCRDYVGMIKLQS